MKYALINGIILNGHEDMKEQIGLAILVENEKIVGIVDQNQDLSAYETIDLQGHYIMPGLINLHVHLPATGKPKKKQSDAKKLVNLVRKFKPMQAYLKGVMKQAAKDELYSGVTSLRTMGGVDHYDSWLRDQIDQNQEVGPRILAGNMALSVPGGHMAGSLAYEVKSEQEVLPTLDKICATKPDVIKLMITGGVLDATKKGEPGVLKMPASYVKIACDKAHSLGYKVAAHVESTQGVKVALENGVDTIEHGAKLTPELIELFKQRKAVHVATISPALPYALFDRTVSHVDEMGQYNGKVVFDGVLDCAKVCLENGIPVGLGTDTGCPFVKHYDMWRELDYFHKYLGVSNQFALYTATKLNAKIAGIDQITGTIDVGKSADLIVTKQNPLENLEALRNLEMVIFRGKRLEQIKIKKMKNVEEQLDRYL